MALWVILAILGVIALALGRYAFPDVPASRVCYSIGWVLLAIAGILFVVWLFAFLAVDSDDDVEVDNDGMGYSLVLE